MRNTGLKRKIHFTEIENLRPTWAEIDLDSLAFNIGLIRKKVGISRIFPVVKADAYGHGAVQVCRALENHDCDYLCLGLLEEGIELRRNKIDLPFLILGPLELYQLEEAILNRFTPSAYRLDIIDEIDRIARKLRRKVPFHLKIDTGMGRLGFLPEQVAAVAERVRKLRNSYVEGVFSNFSSADEPQKPATKKQLKRFHEFVSAFAKEGIRVRIRHSANSSAILNFPASHMDAVRPGLLIYGINPPLSPLKIHVRPVLSLKSRIISLKEFSANTPIGYSGKFVTRRRSRIAVLPIGYDDGLMRALSPGGEVILKGNRVPIVGAVSMDLITVDVSMLDGVRIGDVATLVGRESSQTILVSDLAHKAGTIPYEIICRIGRRVPRIYIKDRRVFTCRAFHRS